MKILLVWPNKGSYGFKPMGLALLASALKQQGHEVELFDTSFLDFGYVTHNQIRNKIRVFKPSHLQCYDIKNPSASLAATLVKLLDDFKPALVGISVLSDEEDIAGAISSLVKSWRGDTVVLWGNKGPTFSPQKILEKYDVDYICIGEGIEALPEIARCLEGGTSPSKIQNIAYLQQNLRIRRNRLRPLIKSLDTLPPVDWSIFDKRHFTRPFNGKVYIGGEHMITWGCPYSCTYCTNASYRKLYDVSNSDYIRSYGIPRILAELRDLAQRWSIELYKFLDDDFCFKDIDYFRTLAKSYRKMVNIPFIAMANAKNLTDEKVTLLKHMNCIGITVGIESGNDIARRDILKRTDTKEEILNAVRRLNRAGIITASFNMLGIPFESRSRIMETIELNRKSKVRYPNTFFYYPLESTELREMAIKEGFLPSEASNAYDDLYPTLSFSNISESELVALRERFSLYSKLPRSYHKYIMRSEQADRIGKRLTVELYRIFDESVLENDGAWNARGKSAMYLRRLETINKGRTI